MKQKISRTIMAGIIGTIVMTIITFLAPLMGMPKMNPPEMLAGMMSVSIVIGWIMHFMIGIIFAFGYVYIISGWLTKISSQVLKGVVFGVIVFVFAQIAMKIISAMMGGMAASSDNMFLMIMGSIIGHIVYGIGVALAAKEVVAPVPV
jgi:uncharacterized membrane protein YagU involved in acid resistance